MISQMKSADNRGQFKSLSLSAETDESSDRDEMCGRDPDVCVAGPAVGVSSDGRGTICLRKLNSAYDVLSEEEGIMRFEEIDDDG